MTDTTQPKQTPPRTTAAQLRIALALAEYYGHEWPDAFGGGDREWADDWEPLTIEELDGQLAHAAAAAIHAKVVEQANPDGIGGITHPQWDTDGDIHHTTTSGRLSWMIDVRGRVTLNVWRPDDVHAMLVVLDERGDVDRLEVTDACRLRHLDAAGFAMRVVRRVHVPVVIGEPDTAPDWCDNHLGPLRRKVALADYADIKARVVAVRRECEMIEAANMELHDEALDCQLPHTWGLEALRAWCEQVAIGTGYAGW